MSKRPTTIFIVDDHKMFRQGLRALLEEEGVEILAEASSGEKALELLQDGLKPDVILMDINLQGMNGFATTERIKKAEPDIPILGLTMHEQGEYIDRMIEAGASGYVFKQSGEDELVDAIEKVANGEGFFSSKASRVLIDHLWSPIQKKSEMPEKEALTDRERDVLQLIAKELTSIEIAKELQISPKTVDTHKRNLFQKLQVKNTAGLIRLAMEREWIDNEED